MGGSPVTPRWLSLFAATELAYLLTGCALVVPSPKNMVLTYVDTLDGVDRDVGTRIISTVVLHLVLAPDSPTKGVPDPWSPVKGFRSYSSYPWPWARSIAEFLVRPREAIALLILSGRALPFEGDNVVLWQLSIPRLEARDRAAVQGWTVRINTPADNFEVSVDLPARFMSLPPVVLSQSLVEELRSSRDLEIFEDKERTRPTGSFLFDRSGFRSAFSILSTEFHTSGPDMLEVSVREGTRGWVKMPPLVAQQQGAVDLAGGIASAIGGASDSARRFFDKVLQAEGTSTANKFFVYLFRGMAEEKAGRSAREDFAKAQRLNPGSEVPAKYIVMSYLGEVQRLQSRDPMDPRVREILRELNTHLAQASQLLAQDARWTTELIAKLRDFQRFADDEPTAAK